MVRPALALLLSAATVLLSMRAEARLPQEIQSLSREDASHAEYHLYAGRRRCGFYIVAREEGYRRYLESFPNQQQLYLRRTAVISRDMRRDLFKEGKRVRRETFTEDIQKVIAGLTDIGGNRPTVLHLADAFDDAGLGIGSEAIRRGIIPPLSPVETAEASVPRFQSLFYLLKINEGLIPRFLLDHGRFRFDRNEITYSPQGIADDQIPDPPFRRYNLYFDEGIFWGAEISSTELARFGAHLASAKKLEHLTLKVRLADLAHVLQSPVLPRLRSLTLHLYDDLNVSLLPATEAEIADTLAQLGHFRNLRSLTVESLSAHRLEANGVLRFFRSARHLEHLDLKQFDIDDEAPPDILSHLTSLVLDDIRVRLSGFPLSREQALEQTRARLQAFWGHVNPAIQSIDWMQGDRVGNYYAETIGDVFFSAAPFTGLRHFRIETNPIAPDQWERLSEIPGMWEKLETFHALVHNRAGGGVPAAPLRTLYAVRNILTRAKPLNDFWFEFPLGEIQRAWLFDGRTAPPNRAILAEDRVIRRAGRDEESP